MRITTKSGRRREATSRAFSLVEVVLSMAIAAVAIGGMVYGYIMSAQRAEWSAYSLAAQSLAVQRSEQTRACKWDPSGFPPVDELVAANFPVVVDILDIPISGTNLVYATNWTTITTVSTTPALRMIQVDCVWKFMNRGVFTNTIVTYRGPDQ